MNLDAQIEAILFYKGEAIKKSKLSESLSVDLEQIEKGLNDLEQRLIDTKSGLALVRLEDEVQISTVKEISPVIEKITKEELIRDLGKAGLETLSIIIYKSPVTRADIDYVRGVNSQFILRNLLIRGLIERISNPNNSRSFLYKPTFDLLSHLGVSKIEDLPEFQNIKNDLDSIEKNIVNE
ncbi:MAG: SMC-Scp complex subunit ScpB [bacterium]|nr:SMC-Scp complex subunit ScpB [bacterium]